MKGIFLVLLALGICFLFTNGSHSFQDSEWRNISGDIAGVNAVWVKSDDPQIIIVGTAKGIFRTENAGVSWQRVLFGINKSVNFLYADLNNKDLIYAGCQSGLFTSSNQGRTWRRIYSRESEEETNCLGLARLENKKIFLGTEGGLMISENDGRSWYKSSGSLSNQPVWALASNRRENIIYIGTCQGLFRMDLQGKTERVFFMPSDESVEENQGDETQEEPDIIKHIYLSPTGNNHVFLATSKGIFESNDYGDSWIRFNDSGILNTRVNTIMAFGDSFLLSTSESGIYIYGLIPGRWQELSFNLNMQNIRALAVDNAGHIYAGGSTGLFKRKSYDGIEGGYHEICEEPDIQEVQQAAIRYARIVSPESISKHARFARLKAILPELSLDYDKTISAYNNSKSSRFVVGPCDWGISFKWSLGDLIWSEQQRLIDSQARLMVKLRQEILDEVTRLYFQRVQLKSEISSFENVNPAQLRDKELKIKELTALLDGFTGGYFSKRNSLK